MDETDGDQFQTKRFKTEGFNLEMMIEQLPPLSLEDFQLKKRARKKRCSQSPVNLNKIQSNDNLISNRSTSSMQLTSDGHRVEYNVSRNDTKSSPNYRDHSNKVINKYEPYLNKNTVGNTASYTESFKRKQDQGGRDLVKNPLVSNSDSNNFKKESDNEDKRLTNSSMLSMNKFKVRETGVVKTCSNYSNFGDRISFISENHRQRTYSKRPLPSNDLKESYSSYMNNRDVPKSKSKIFDPDTRNKCFKSTAGNENFRDEHDSRNKPKHSSDSYRMNLSSDSKRNTDQHVHHSEVKAEGWHSKYADSSLRSVNSIKEAVIKKSQQTEYNIRLTATSLVGSQKRKALKKNITRLAPGSNKKDTSVVEVNLFEQIGSLATLAEVAANEKRLLH